MNEEAFGPGRFVRAAVLLRETGKHDINSSFCCRNDEEIIGSVRMTPIYIGIVKGYLLGSIVVRPSYKNKGIGRKLIQMAIDAAKSKGSDVVILVGDFSYYSRLGFKSVPWKAIIFPAPIDPQRVMFFPIVDNIVEKLKGKILFDSSQ
ncbi:GNAT family N-acetyltransferase [Candidatus Liberibacter americanus]|uniref:Acetyltransferase n=1 Tax=Candidatus Liberibacter americanus str. Sao Paulo TaxID=1261131 RepID=U6B5D0_9HYPH|nr:N-acetyltransferase [Candidatus Liberibacter americanus]AHA28150.1 acetyltransferase [Candidatus Liberibacter americanus str. Sao Paulo]EMS35938.1 GCN5-related N-acetyltransferase [Candidatus Liberibacter americanus PW_SP]